MTTRIGRAVTEVVGSGEEHSAPADPDPRWADLERARKLRRQLDRLEARTRAQDRVD